MNEATPDSAPLRRRKFVAAGLVAVVVLLVAGSIWYIALGPGRSGGQPRTVVAHFTGDGNTKTDSFAVRTGWQIQWNSDGSKFAFAIRGDVDMGTVVSHPGAGSGITSPVPSGRFFLEVMAEGPWEITILQGD